MTTVERKETGLSGYVGFETITEQIEKKFLKRGFQLNIMVVGETGLGKSTLINTLFSAHLVDSKGRRLVSEPIHKTLDINSATHNITENGVKLKLTIVDTPGFGDQVNNDNCWEGIIKYLKDQHAAYLRKELTASRNRFIDDTRVHCCLFFIAPTGHSLKPIDILVLKKLTEVVNVVPVIAKSDSLTPEERQAFKQRIKEEFVHHDIKLYPYDSPEDEEEDIELNKSIRELIPFAVVGSEKDVIIDEKPVRGRRNRWGVINVEDENHCEFVHLRNFLTRSHLQDLIETTAYIHYEGFRARQLLALRDDGEQPQAN